MKKKPAGVHTLGVGEHMIPLNYALKHDFRKFYQETPVQLPSSACFSKLITKEVFPYMLCCRRPSIVVSLERWLRSMVRSLDYAVLPHFVNLCASKFRHWPWTTWKFLSLCGIWSSSSFQHGIPFHRTWIFQYSSSYSSWEQLGERLRAYHFKQVHATVVCALDIQSSGLFWYTLPHVLHADHHIVTSESLNLWSCCQLILKSKVCPVSQLQRRFSNQKLAIHDEPRELRVPWQPTLCIICGGNFRVPNISWLTHRNGQESFSDCSDKIQQYFRGPCQRPRQAVALGYNCRAKASMAVMNREQSYEGKCPEYASEWRKWWQCQSRELLDAAQCTARLLQRAVGGTARLHFFDWSNGKGRPT